MDKKTIGIIGGMGPMATVELFRMIVANTKSSCDQEHIHILIDNNTNIPDRTAAIIGNGISPVQSIVNSAHVLENSAADFLIIPCNTSHFFFDEIQKECKVPILNMIEETVNVLKNNNIPAVGLLGTTGTIRGRVYEKKLNAAGLRLITPDETDQKTVMDFIYYGVKSGNYYYDTRPLMKVVNKMFYEGAKTIILGCTEIPVGLKMYNLSFDYIDSLEMLANAAIKYAGYELKEY